MVRTIVLIPGLTCDATYWAHQCRALGRFGEVLVPRLHDFDSLVAMAESVLDATTGELDVVGHSMGGRVAFEIVRAAPGRIRSLALLDTAAHPAGVDEPAKRQVRLDLAASGGMEALADDWIPEMIGRARHGDAELVAAIRAMVTSYTVEQYRGQIRALLERPDARPLLGEIGCPTLVACGRHDAWSPLAAHEEMAAAVPGARMAVIEEAGHMVAMEQPETTTRLLADWLADVAPATSDAPEGART